MMPADVPARPRSLRVIHRCSGKSMKARKIAQAIDPAKGCQHQQHAVGHQGGQRDEEGFCVELHVHP